MKPPRDSALSRAHTPIERKKSHVRGPSLLHHRLTNWWWWWWCTTITHRPPRANERLFYKEGRQLRKPLIRPARRRPPRHRRICDFALRGRRVVTCPLQSLSLGMDAIDARRRACLRTRLGSHDSPGPLMHAGAVRELALAARITLTSTTSNPAAGGGGCGVGRVDAQREPSFRSDAVHGNGADARTPVAPVAPVVVRFQRGGVRWTRVLARASIRPWSKSTQVS